MKLHYPKILLFFFLLNILVTSYQAHNNNSEPHTTSRHTPIYISRILSECDIESSNYDNDTEMKSVKENFDRQTLQRFEEYEERMEDKRQKYKEQRDKNIQKIIEKDKMDKSLEEKIEKGCLRCGCALGGVAASVGLFGGIGEAAISALKPLALKAATQEAITEATDLATQAGIDAVVSKIKVFIAAFNEKEGVFDLLPIVSKSNFNSTKALHKSALELASKSCKFGGRESTPSFCSTIQNGETTTFKGFAEAGIAEFETTLTTKTAEFEAAKVAKVDAISSSFQTSITATVVTILVIVLVMIIIYLVLRYRRKKKMNKKAQYTKLLNQ